MRFSSYSNNNNSSLFADPTALISQTTTATTNATSTCEGEGKSLVLNKQHPLFAIIADWQSIDISGIGLVCEDNSKGYYLEGVFNSIYSEFNKFYLTSTDNNIWAFKFKPNNNAESLKIEPIGISPNLSLKFELPNTRITCIKRAYLNPDNFSENGEPYLGNDALIIGRSDSSLIVLDPITLQPINFINLNLNSSVKSIEVIGHYLIICLDSYGLRIVNWFKDYKKLTIFNSNQFNNSGVLIKKQIELEEEDTLIYNLKIPNSITSGNNVKFFSLVVNRFGTIEIRKFKKLEEFTLIFDVLVTGYLKDFIPIGGIPLVADGDEQDNQNVFKFCFWSIKYLVTVSYNYKLNKLTHSESIKFPVEVSDRVKDHWERVLLYRDDCLIASSKSGKLFKFRPTSSSQSSWKLSEDYELNSQLESSDRHCRALTYSLPFISNTKEFSILQLKHNNDHHSSSKFSANLINLNCSNLSLSSEGSKTLFPYLDSHPHLVDKQIKQKTLQISLNVSQLARGHNDGTILLIPLPHIFTPSSHLLPFASPGSDIVLLDNGQRSAITYLLDPISTMSTQFKNHLVSGTADGSVHVWEINSHALLFSSTIQQSPIVKLFQMPIIANSQLNDTVFCLAKDNSISIISLKRMSNLGLIPSSRNQIKSLQWSCESNELVIIYSDDSKLLWRFPDGELTIFDEANIVFEWDCGVNLHDSPIPNWSSLGLHHTITSVPIYSYPNPAPMMQIHLINIKRLLSDLHNGNAPSINMTNGVEFIYSVHQNRFDGNNGIQANPSAVRSPQAQDFPSQPITGLAHRLAHTILSALLHPEEVPSIGEGCYDHSSFAFKSMLSLGIRGRSTNGFGIPACHLAPNRDAYFGWKTSPIASATRLLPILTLAKPVLSTKSKPETSWIQLTTSYGTLLGDRVQDAYQPSSLFYLSKFWPDLSPEISQATRVGFISSFGHYPKEQQLNIVKYWGIRLAKINCNPTSITQIRACLILAIIGSEYDIIEPSLCPRIAKSLTYLISEVVSADLRMMAIDLISKGFTTWEKHVDPSAVLYPLFKSAQIWGDSGSGSAKIIYQAILNICIASPTLFASTASLALIGQITPDFYQSDNLKAVESPRVGVLKALSHVIRNRPTLLVPFISPLIESLIKVLDPKDPILRKSIIQDATQLLFDVVETYSFVDFHKPTQRLAVGTLEGAVVIYDVRTSTRYQVFEGSMGQITAAAISPDGKFLASYSNSDQTLNIWQQSSGFLDLIARSFRSPSPSPLPTTPLQSLFRRSSNYSQSAPGSGRTSPEDTKDVSKTPQPQGTANLKVPNVHPANPPPATHSTSSAPYRSFQLGTLTASSPRSPTSEWERIEWISDRELVIKKPDQSSSLFDTPQKQVPSIELKLDGNNSGNENELRDSSQNELKELRFKI